MDAERAGMLDRSDSWARWVTLAAVVTAVVMVGIKLAGWLFSGSVAVLGALADSGLDLVSSFAAFTAVRYAALPPDENHRFGHQKAEAVSALLQTALIAASANFVLIESVGRLIEPQPIERAGVALGVLAASVALTIGLVAFQTFAIKRSGSLVIKADRAHYTGDILSNLGLLLAVFLTARFGILRADGIAGLAAAGFLFWSVKEVAEAALPQLMDEELPDEERSEIERIIAADPDVTGYHNLRTRRAGSRRFIQVDLEMPGSLTLSRAHRIAHRVSDALQEAFPGADVLVHQDTGDDDDPVEEAISA